MNYKCTKDVTIKRGNRNKRYRKLDIISQDEFDSLPSFAKSNFVSEEPIEPEYEEDDVRVNASLIDDLTNPSVDPYEPPSTPDTPQQDFDFGGGSSGGAGASGTY